jgi:hypothetical protein
LGKRQRSRPETSVECGEHDFLFFIFKKSISPSKVDGYNVLLAVCLGGIFVFGLGISIGYPNFL